MNASDRYGKVFENFVKWLLNLVVYVCIGAIIAGLIVWYSWHSDPASGGQGILRWGGLGLNTALLYGYVVKGARPFWKAWAFWSTIVGVFSLHLLFFVVVLQRIEHWSAVWFLLMYPVEVPLIAIVSDWAVNASGTRPRIKR